MRIRAKTVLLAKWKESFAAVLPITAVVFLLCFFIIDVPNDLLLAFLCGAGMLVVGMGLFTLGADLSMTVVGDRIGSTLTKTRKLWLILVVSFLVGVFVTVSEPDLQVLAGLVPGISDNAIILAVALGVGLFLAGAMLRILLKIRLTYLLIGFYALTFLLAYFAPRDLLAVAFDAGGVTTGPMTVPFILSLGAGVAAIRADNDAETDAFGLVSLCSVGPILAFLLLAIFFAPSGTVYEPNALPQAATSRGLAGLFSAAFPAFVGEMALSLLPILVLFFVFQFASFRLGRSALIRIAVGFLYTYLGLVLFLCGASVGFMPVARCIGEKLGALDAPLFLVPVGALTGWFIVSAEPAVHVLGRQVYEMTSGAVAAGALKTSLSVGVAISAGLSMLRVVTGIPIMAFLIPGYLTAIVLSFFVPPMFTAIAFDSGGVASGPMTAAFLLPLAMGACLALGRDVVSYGFGVVAMVAMTPLITIQLFGLYYTYQAKKRQPVPETPLEELTDTEILEQDEEKEG